MESLNEGDGGTIGDLLGGGANNDGFVGDVVSGSAESIPDINGVVGNILDNSTEPVGNVLEDLVGDGTCVAEGERCKNRFVSPCCDGLTCDPSTITCQLSTSVNFTNPEDVEDAIEDFVNNATASAPDIEEVVGNFLGDNSTESFNDISTLVGDFVGDGTCVAEGQRCKNKLVSPCCVGLTCNRQSITCEAEVSVSSQQESSPNNIVQPSTITDPASPPDTFDAPPGATPEDVQNFVGDLLDTVNTAVEDTGGTVDSTSSTGSCIVESVRCKARVPCCGGLFCDFTTFTCQIQ